MVFSKAEVMPLSTFLVAYWPIELGLAYFVVLCICIEVWVVRRRQLSDHALRTIDFLWVCTSAVTLAFLLVTSREGRLKDEITSLETKSATLRQATLEFVRNGDAACMAGTWPAGAVAEKSHRENGFMVTEVCSGVSVFLEFAYDFFSNDELWRRAPSRETTAAFTAAFDHVFGSSFPDRVLRTWTPPRHADDLMVRARDDIAKQASRIVAWKDRAGEITGEVKLVHAVLSAQAFWPLVLATALAFRLGKSRVDLLSAKSKPTPPSMVAVQKSVEPSADADPP